MGAFHAYDIRGVYGKDFDSTTAYKIGFFIPELLGADVVLVGRDCRLSSKEIRDALVRGITDAGADVDDLGLSSTPLVYFGTARYGYKASVQITASHNPKEYNGMKISRENALPVGLDAGLGTIRQWIESGKQIVPAKQKGKVHEKDIFEDYVGFMKSHLDDISNLKVAFDLSNGMSNLFVKTVFGNTPSYVNDSLDGGFPAHEPNPLLEENRRDICNLVKKTGADVGVIYDGDADRVMFVDEKAGFVAPDLVIALLSEYFIKEKGAVNPRVLQEIRSSKAVAEYLEPLGAEVHTWRVGRAYAAPKLREIDGLWGGELAGHYYFKDFYYSDSGVLASILMLNIISSLKKKGTTLSEAIGRISRYKNSGEINFKIEEKQKAMDAVREHFIAKETPVNSMDFDGYRVEFPQWWFNIRPSNTEPYLRFICEATSDSLLAEKVEEAKEIINRYK